LDLKVKDLFTMESRSLKGCSSFCIDKELFNFTLDCPDAQQLYTNLGSKSNS